MPVHHVLVGLGSDDGGHVARAEEPINVHLVSGKERLQCRRQQLVC